VAHRGRREYAEFCRDLLELVQDELRAGSSVDEVVANLELPEQYGGYDLQRARAYVETVCRRAPLEELFKLNEIAGVIHTCVQVARWSRHHPQDIGVG
jgi:hypothetical protein